jgi:hypothetical protein
VRPGCGCRRRKHTGLNRSKAPRRTRAPSMLSYPALQLLPDRISRSARVEFRTRRPTVPFSVHQNRCKTTSFAGPPLISLMRKLTPVQIDASNDGFELPVSAWHSGSRPLSRECGNRTGFNGCGAARCSRTSGLGGRQVSGTWKARTGLPLGVSQRGGRPDIIDFGNAVHTNCCDCREQLMLPAKVFDRCVLMSRFE